MKIAFVNQPFDIILPPFQNSVGACTYGPACALAKSHDVTVYGLLQPKQMEPEVLYRNVRFRFLPPSAWDNSLHTLHSTWSKIGGISSPLSTSSLLFPSYGHQVAKELQKERFDVIHIQHSSQYVPVIRRLNPDAKIVLHLHAEWFSQCHPAELAQRLKGLDLLTTVSDHITRKVRTQVPALAHQCETVYNGINDHEFCAERDYTARKPGPRRIMYAGGVSPHKGIHVLLEAFQIIEKSFPDVQLDVVGPHGIYPIKETFDLENRAVVDQLAPFYPNALLSTIRRKLGHSDLDPYVNFLRSRVSGSAAGKVNFLGIIPRPELIQRYYDADIFVFPPIWDEGFGIPPIEAMGAGAAVVGSRSGGVMETVLHGETGLLVEKNDARALAEAILTLLGDDRLTERLGRAGRRRVLENFTWTHIAEKLEHEYLLACSTTAIQPSPAKPENVCA